MAGDEGALTVSVQAWHPPWWDRNIDDDNPWETHEDAAQAVSAQTGCICEDAAQLAPLRFTGLLAGMVWYGARTWSR